MASVDVIAPELEASAEKLANLRLVIDNQYTVVIVWHLGHLSWSAIAEVERNSPSSI
jgi:hypothetical protein